MMIFKRIARRMAGALSLACACALITATPEAMAVDAKARTVTVKSWDGTSLSAVVMEPTTGQGPYPLVVMPSSWMLNKLEYAGRGMTMARRGYVVVSYTSRGFWESGGLIDHGEAATVKDLSTVIDWALRNTASDPSRIGASGISYGGGVSLLAAAQDPRIKAVAGLSTWADAAESSFPNQTANAQFAWFSAGGAALTGRPGPAMQTLIDKIADGDTDGGVRGFNTTAIERSPSSYVSRFNANGTAILLANGFNDSLFPPNQLVKFFNQLTGKKQLMLVQGDHTTADLPGAAGLPNAVYDRVERWFDRQLKGVNNGVDGEAPITLQSFQKQTLSFDSWQQVQAPLARWGMSAPAGLSRVGELKSGSFNGWSHSIRTGVYTIANNGPIFLSGFFQDFGVPPLTAIPLITRSGAGIWQTAAMDRDRVLAGMPHLRITVKPSQRDVTLQTYLYSVNALGIGQLVSYQPYSLRNVTAGQPRTLDIDLQASAFTIKRGNRLALVIDTSDPRFADLTRSGGTVEFSSPASAPSQFSVPLH